MSESDTYRYSRQNSSLSSKRSRLGFVVHVLKSPVCRLFTVIAVIFSAGIWFGVYLDTHFLSDVSSVLPWRLARQVQVYTVQHTDHHHVEEEQVTKSGQSIKKDLSVQFKDYLPRHILIDSSVGGPPLSLDLFLHTYPDAHNFVIYAFLADRSRSPLYAKFSNITLFPGTIVSTNQTTHMMTFHNSGVNANRSVPVTSIDFGAWLRETVHPDDYVVVKLSATNADNEVGIVKHLVDTHTLEWVDKWYTTSDDADVVSITKERFATQGHSVFFWKDDVYTYSDFNAINPPPVSRDENVVITQCKEDSNSSHFALVLYFSQANKYSAASLDLIVQMSASRSVPFPVTVFLPLDYLDAESTCSSLASLGKHVELGLFQEKGLTHVKCKRDKQSKNYIRNKLVSAEHCFAQGNTTLEYVLASSTLSPSDKKLSSNEAFVKTMLSERMYIRVVKMKDITPQFPFQDGARLPSGLENGAVLGVDVGADGSEVLLLQLLTSHLSSLVPMRACVDREILKLRKRDL